MKLRNCTNALKIFALTLSLSLAVSGCQWVKGILSHEETHEAVEKVSRDTIRVYREALSNLKVGRAQSAPFPELLSLMGKVSLTEDRTTVVPARVTGRIEKIFFASGEHVQAGQVLATVFSPDFISAREEYLQSLKQSTAAQNSDPTSSRSADSSDFANLAKMSKRKLETMGLSPADIATLSEGDADPNHQPLLQIRAPRTGVLIQKNAVLGNLINVGDTLFLIGDLGKVWFSGDIFPEDLQKVKKGQEVVINAAGVDKPLMGTVSFISPLVDATSRSIKIRALMDNPGDALKADEYVQGNVVLAKRDAIIVPTSTIVRYGGDTFVFKRASPPTLESSTEKTDFQRVKVTLGPEQSGLVAVSSGLSDGEEVVTDGGLLLDAALNADSDTTTEKK